jgi:hypothetical protein
MWLKLLCAVLATGASAGLFGWPTDPSKVWVKGAWVDIVDHRGHLPLPPPPVEQDVDPKIFIGIASFKDARCGQTLQNAFSKALRPGSVYIGVVRQNAAADVDCLQRYCELARAAKGLGAEADCPYKDNVVLETRADTDAEGPVLARHWQQKLLAQVHRYREFCLQIDSHSDFITGWDVALLEQWRGAANEMAILR